MANAREVAVMTNPTLNPEELANDLGAWVDSGMQSLQAPRIRAGYEDLEAILGRELIWVLTERHLKLIRARCNSLKKEQRQQLAEKDAIITQLRERLDRARRGN